MRFSTVRMCAFCKRSCGKDDATSRRSEKRRDCRADAILKGVKTVEIRQARPDDAEEACMVVRSSIVELCRADHQADAATIAAWLANKTAENMRRWICQAFVFVATDQ